MGGGARIVGIVLIVFGLIACVVVGALMAAQLSAGENTASGAILGLGLAFFVIVAPSVGAGIYLLVRGSQEATQLAEVEKERKLLNIVLTRGQVSLSDLVLELQSNRDQVKAWIYDLVGKGLFSGYINWDEGILYSRQAGDLRSSQKCPNCGGEQAYAGKGVITCPYCGSDLFLAT
jgi:ribosomal protein S27AE